MVWIESTSGRFYSDPSFKGVYINKLQKRFEYFIMFDFNGIGTLVTSAPPEDVLNKLEFKYKELELKSRGNEYVFLLDGPIPLTPNYMTVAFNKEDIVFGKDNIIEFGEKTNDKSE